MSVKFAFLVGLIALPYAAGQGRSVQDPSTLSRVSSPLLGFVFDAATHRLRPIWGIPGASLMGQPLDLGFDVADAAVSPQQNFVLALASDTGAVLLLCQQNGDLSVRTLNEVAPAPDRTVLSPSGSAAALYYAATGRIQPVTGLPDAPALAPPVDASGLGGPLGPLAISDDGQVLLAAGGASSLLLFAQNNGVVPLPVSDQVTALAFRMQAHDAVVATRDNRVSLIRNVDNNPQYQAIANQDDGIGGPVAVAFARDGARVFVASADAGSLAAFDLMGAPPALVSCHCTPTGLHRLNGPALFRLTEISANPLLLLDGASALPRVLFVPPDTPSVQGGGQ